MRLRTFFIISLIISILVFFVLFSINTKDLLKNSFDTLNDQYLTHNASIITAFMENKKQFMSNFTKTINSDDDFSTTYVLSYETKDRILMLDKINVLKEKTSFDLIDIVSFSNKSFLYDKTLFDNRTVKDRLSKQDFSLIEINKKFYFISTSPLKLYDDTVGILVLGYLIDPTLINEIKKTIRSDELVLYSGDKSITPEIGNHRQKEVFRDIAILKSNSVDLYARIYISNDFLKKANTELLMNLIKSGAITLIILALILYVILELGFFKKLNDFTNSLSEYSRELAKGRITKTNIHGSFIREIDQLNSSFTQLSESLLEFKAKLAESSRLAAIGSLTSMLAHDVMRPFSSVKLVLNNFKAFSDTPGMIEKARQDIDNAIKDVESMISDIMNFSRQVKLVTSPCPVTTLIDSSIKKTALAFPDMNIKFSYNFRHSKKPLIDEQHFSRVITNIVSNAIEAIKDHKATEQGEICFSTSEEQADGARHFIIEIDNNGPKIEEEDLDKIFEPFFTKNKKKGTGLGLASAKRIVHLHDGHISVKNLKNDLGVRLSIFIPSSEEDENIDVINIPTSLSGFKTLIDTNEKSIDRILENLIYNKQYFNVLLLEDETLYRAAIKNLDDKGHNLKSLITFYDAQTVDEAVLLIKNQELTHAIVDVDLNDRQNGFDFLREIRSFNKDIHVLIHSNRCIKEDVEKAISLGARGFAKKPLSVESLVLFLAGQKVYETRSN